MSDALSFTMFDGDWPENEREQVVELVETIEQTTTLPTPPENWMPWYVKRITLEGNTIYIAHRWHLETIPHARSLGELLQKMETLATSTV